MDSFSKIINNFPDYFLDSHPMKLWNNKIPIIWFLIPLSHNFFAVAKPNPEFRLITIAVSLVIFF